MNSTSQEELFGDEKLRKMLESKYGKPNHTPIEGSGEYGKGFTKGYNLGYDDGARHSWQEAKLIIEEVVKYYNKKP